MNPIEQKLSQQLGAQMLEIIRLHTALEEAQKEIARLSALLPMDAGAKEDGNAAHVATIN